MNFNKRMIKDEEQMMQRELGRMRSETQNLELSLMQRYKGDELNTYQDLLQLEHQLQHSLDKVRARKVRTINIHPFIHFFYIYS